jgi:hypothetical protein
LCAFLIVLMCSTCPAHLILLDFITLTVIFSEAYKLWSPYYTVFSSLLPLPPS